MELRTEMVGPDSTSSSPYAAARQDDDGQDYLHDAAAAHALLQALDDAGNGKLGRSFTPYTVVIRADELMALWQGYTAPPKPPKSEVTKHRSVGGRDVWTIRPSFGESFDVVKLCEVHTAYAHGRCDGWEAAKPNSAAAPISATQYQEWVLQNWSRRKLASTDDLRDLFIMSVGIGGEAGEVQELHKKMVRDGREIKDDLRLELGDVLHYLTRIASNFDMTLEEIMAANREKIDARHANRVAKAAGEVSHG
ncbi:nucleoside triphosphate pyrophosphohydrolase family protein [Dyella sp.]|uniref:nucleoside triphosphate pyrophosphohydrolase family protein n=1 Tax=Dyella sp. TaxID=1869338 RepID=UPI00283DD884|nr:nucleoside triphosphate pyrophosphohydrolase family protein [Dyella sp.]MDR3446659.1 nucleoside triphosphate pyrophosphohydrolase family protein [Dyella sp.]